MSDQRTILDINVVGFSVHGEIDTLVALGRHGTTYSVWAEDVDSDHKTLFAFRPVCRLEYADAKKIFRELVDELSGF